jgi:CRISPR-associated protein Cmr5
MVTLAQQRSAFALRMVQEVFQNQQGFDKLVLGVPAMILQSGFGQTLAFCLAKGTKDGRINPGDKHIQAFNIIIAWLRDQKIINQEGGASQVMQQISQMPQQEYLYAQEEALSLLEWVKRYANAGLFS